MADMQFKFTGFSTGVEQTKQIAKQSERVGNADKESAKAWASKLRGMKAAAGHQQKVGMLFPGTTGAAIPRMSFKGGIGASAAIAARDKTHAEQFAWYDKTTKEQGRTRGGSGPGMSGNKVGGGILARFGAAAGSGAFGQIGAALSGPIGAIGIAAVGVGLSMRIMTKNIEANIKAIEAEVTKRASITKSMEEAGKTADQKAVSYAVGNRRDLIGGGRGTPELKNAFREYDAQNKMLGQEQVARFIKVGGRTVSEERASITAPEMVVLGQAFKEAQAQTKVQEQIRDSMTWVQKLYEGLGNQMSGRSWNAREYDAKRNEAATIGDN